MKITNEQWARLTDSERREVNSLAAKLRQMRKQVGTVKADAVARNIEGECHVVLTRIENIVRRI